MLVPVAFSLLGTCQVSLGLSQAQAELGILDDDQRIALPYGLELLKAHLADEALHTGVLWHYVLTHTRIVGKLHISEVHELANHEDGTCHKQQDNENVVNYSADITLFHYCMCVCC